MRVLIVGSEGQLGRELGRAAWPVGVELVAPARSRLDVSDSEAVLALVTEQRPDLLLNATAHSLVDAAEAEPEAAFRVNRDGADNLARASANARIPLIHVSTDFVFDGTQAAPYGEDAATRPINVYGESKLAGELAVRKQVAEHLIVRTSWLFSAFRRNFVKAMVALAHNVGPVRVVNDQFGRPTAAADLARALVQMISECGSARDRGRPPPWGTYHFAGRGHVSRYDLAKYIFELVRDPSSAGPELVPVATTEYPTPARRPMNAVLDTSKIERIFGIFPQDWQAGVAEVVRELNASS